MDHIVLPGAPVSWIHFGDLHIRSGADQNYRDFLALIEEANRMREGIAFGFLPGDNADDGDEDQYVLVQQAVGRSKVPMQVIAGDHDAAGGSLQLFRAYLAEEPYRSFSTQGVHFVFLNSVDVWNAPVFGLGAGQMAWLRGDLATAHERGERSVVFLHAYPAEHGDSAAELSSVLAKSGVLLVEMGHTHYNELANDGHIVYATTRSTGQVEEGPPGFSVGTVDGGVVSWVFKPIGEAAVAMITSPADERLIVDPASASQVVRGVIPVRARFWGADIRTAEMRINGITAPLYAAGDGCTWMATLDSSFVADGTHTLEASAVTGEGSVISDRIRIRVHQAGQYDAPRREAIDYENALGAWPEKHIAGTQLGPNENGHGWPPSVDAERRGK